jgi:hypothetical protein
LRETRRGPTAIAAILQLAIHFVRKEQNRGDAKNCGYHFSGILRIRISGQIYWSKPGFVFEVFFFPVQISGSDIIYIHIYICKFLIN